MRQALFVLFAPAVAGCSLLYNPNNLPNPASDAAADVEVILDADPTMLMVNGVAPAVINEGQGDGNSPPALIVLSGHNMIDANFTPVLTPETPLPAGAQMPVVGAAIVAKDGNWVAFPVTAHADPMLAPTDRILFDIQVQEDIPSQPGQHSMATLSGMLALQGLPELTTGTMIDTSSLAPLYSEVNLTAAASFTGTARAIIHATSSITVTNLTADGQSGAAAKFVGGCAAGGPGSPGDCTGGGAGQGNGGGLSGFGGGGGGGGFGVDGSPGSASGAGGAGHKTGDPLIVTYDGTGGSPANTAEGGGGGGPAGSLLGANAGVSGGTGGGTIELTADGDVTAGNISAKGGVGQAATGSSGGAGGGGAGGLVMLRAGHTLTAGTISVDGGAGGKGNGSNGGGGMGGHGRVRWDGATGNTPASSTTDAVHRGPAFTLASYVFRDPKAKITMIGTPNDVFTVHTTNYGVDGTMAAIGQQVMFSSDGTASFTQTLQQGLTQLCITLMGGAPGSNEADKCVYVAFLP